MKKPTIKKVTNVVTGNKKASCTCCGGSAK